MSKSTRLRDEDWRAIIRLAGECRELGDDARAWQGHYIESMARLIDADAGSAGETEGHASGQPRGLGEVDWGYSHGSSPSDLGELYHIIQAKPDLYTIIPSYFRDFSRRGLSPGKALARGDLIDDAEWYRSECYGIIHRQLGVDDAMISSKPLDANHPGVHNSVILYRLSARRGFSARHRAIVTEAQAAIVPSMGGVLARFQEPSPGDLPPRLRQVLACLLEGESDKRIALRLRLSAYTVNEYTKAIYRHFGVRSRAELLARWIRRGWGRGWDGPPV